MRMVERVRVPIAVAGAITLGMLAVPRRHVPAPPVVIANVPASLELEGTPCIASSSSYRDMSILGMVKGGRVLLVDRGNLGHLVAVGACVGSEHAILTSIDAHKSCLAFTIGGTRDQVCRPCVAPDASFLDLYVAGVFGDVALLTDRDHAAVYRVRPGDCVGKERARVARFADNNVFFE